MKQFFLAIIPILFLAGCATIMSGSRNTVSIKTDPPMADVLILDRKGKEVFHGQSKAVVELKTGAGYFVPAKYTIKINAPGYQERVIEIKATINGWYFSNIFIGGGIGMLIVDPASGAMWRLKDIAIYETLDKANSSGVLKLKITDLSSLTEDQKKALVRIR